MSQFFVVVDVVSNVGFEQVNAGWEDEQIHLTQKN